MTTEQASTESTTPDTEAAAEATENTEATESTEAKAADSQDSANKSILGQAVDGEESDDQADGEKAEGDDAEDGKADGPPEKYEFTMPEGVELDTELAESFGEDFRELGLTNEQAQKLVDKYTAKKMAEVEKTQKVLDDLQKEVADSTDFGGPDSAKKLQTAKAVLDNYGSERLKSEVIESFAGSHIEVIRLLDKVGQELRKAGKLGEDNSHIRGAAGGQPGQDATLRKLYPNTKV